MRILSYLIGAGDLLRHRNDTEAYSKTYEGRLPYSLLLASFSQVYDNAAAKFVVQPLWPPKRCRICQLQ